MSTQKLNSYVSTLTEVFANKKRINVYEYIVKMLQCGTIFTDLLIDIDLSEV